MTNLTYRGVTYTPAERKAVVGKVDGIIYRGCSTRAVIKASAAPTMTRNWLGHSYQLIF